MNKDDELESTESYEDKILAKKRTFAYCLYGGHSPAEAAITAGYSPKSARQRGNQLKKDPDVIKFLKLIKKCYDNDLPMPKISNDSDNSLEEKSKTEIASVEEVMRVFTQILRRELSNDNVVIVTQTENRLMGQAKTNEAQIIKTKADIKDVIAAGDKILKYQSMFEGNGEKTGGVVILPEITEGE